MNRQPLFCPARRLRYALLASVLCSGVLAHDVRASERMSETGLSDYRHFVLYPHLEKALRAQQENDEQTALAEFRHIHQQAPDNVVLARYLAEAYRHFGHDDKAIAVLEDQRQRHPGDRHLQALLAAIPRSQPAVTTVEQLQAQQKRCDAAPDIRCRRETGQNALTLAQLPIARAQLNDAAFYRSEQGRALENALVQRAIFLQRWPLADEIFSRQNQARTLNAAQKTQWFNVLLAGQLDDRLQTLQSAGLFADAEHTLAAARALATRSDTTALRRYLARQRPRFDTPAQEQGWLYLLTRYGDRPRQDADPLIPQFIANRRTAAAAAFTPALKAGDYPRAQAWLNSLPAEEMLPERYALSVRMGEAAASLRLARQGYRQTPDSGVWLDRYSWQLIRQGRSHDAAALLLKRYPFGGHAAMDMRLLSRLAELLQRYPALINPAQRARLSVPLPGAALRQLQMQFPGVGDACEAVRQLMSPLSATYRTASWQRLAACHRAARPGLALYALQQAEQRRPDAFQHRAVAYQAYAVADYGTAMQAWNALPADAMDDEALMAAAETAQAAGDGAARDRWLEDARKRGLDNREAWWWLYAQRYLPARPEPALAALSHAIALHPSARALVARAALLQRQHLMAEAIDDLRQARVLAPDDGSTHAALGYALWQQGAVRQARDALEKARQAAPDDPLLARQLMFVNQRLADRLQTRRYAREIVDDIDDLATLRPLTPQQVQERFDARRLAEENERRWSVNLDTSSGLCTGAVTAGSNPTGGVAPGKSSHSYTQLEAEYRIGRNMMLDGDMLSVYSRLFADTGGGGVALPVTPLRSGSGIRWKPLYDRVLFLAVEEQLPLGGHQGGTDTLLRASASLLNDGQHSDDWHPNGNGWFAQNLYLDAAHYVRREDQAWTADYRTSWHQKVAHGQTLEPYAHVQINGYRDGHSEINQLAGFGLRWNVWSGQSRYIASPHKVSVGVEYQHSIKAINQPAPAGNQALLTVGVHW